MNSAVFIIVNYNDSDNTIKLINNVKDYKSIKKIVVVDNNSSDDSLDHLRELDIKKLHIIESIHNNGYAKGLNMGAKYAMEEYKNPILIFSNSDIEVESEDTIKNLISNFKNKDIKVVMPKIKEKDNYSYGWKLTSPFKDLLMTIKSYNKLSIVDNREYVIHNHNISIGKNVSDINKYKIYKKSQFYYEKKYNNANALIMFFFKVFYYINLIPYKLKRK